MTIARQSDEVRVIYGSGGLKGDEKQLLALQPDDYIFRPDSIDIALVATGDDVKRILASRPEKKKRTPKKR